ncbi:MAG: YggS family pyridoxal phosphate-dependent enzyme [Clostridia bacterium]|nr:YggS family pyridoxal phosphate-dependent enzyme [Clostridia bacterium]
MDKQAYIESRIACVKEKAAEAAKRGGFAPPTLIAVTKKMTDEELFCTLRAGITDIAENYPQNFARRYELLSQSGIAMPNMHLIGSLQTNKIKLVLGKATLVHSLDRESLARALDKEAKKQNLRAPVLLEINCGREENKGGVLPEEAEALAELVCSLEGLSLRGLMTMAPVCENKEDYRPYFRDVRKLFEKMKESGIFDTADPVLSMGMSGSYEIAAEEGATLIRVGQALYT